MASLREIFTDWVLETLGAKDKLMAWRLCCLEEGILGGLSVSPSL